MSTENNFERLKSGLDAHDQGQILRFWAELSAEQQSGLVAQAAELDLEQIDGWLKPGMQRR